MTPAPQNVSPKPPPSFAEQASMAIRFISLRTPRPIPLSPKGQIWLAQSYRFLGEIEKSEEELKTLFQKPDLDPKKKARALEELSKTLAASRRFEEAEKAIHEALAIKPANPFYHCRQGILFRERGRYVKSSHALRKAIDLNPTQAEFFCEEAITFLKLGQYYQKQGHHADAQDSFEKSSACIDEAIDLNPLHPRHYCEKGLILSRRKDFRGSLSAFDQAIRLDSTHPRHHFEKGMALFLQDNLEEAKISLETGMRLYCSHLIFHPAAQLMLGRIWRAEGKTEEAAALMRNLTERLEKTGCRYPSAYDELISLLIKQGKIDEAGQLLWKAQRYGLRSERLQMLNSLLEEAREN